MRINCASHSRMTVTQVDEFLTKPPPGFSVHRLGSGYRVHSDPEKSLVLIDDFEHCEGKVVFQNSVGRKVKMRNLWEYTRMRKGLLSKSIHLLVSACGATLPACSKRAASGARALKQYVVSIDGNDPFIRWQMEKGLDWTMSSVAGESYRVDVDLSEAVESWAGKNTHIITDELIKAKFVWTDAYFTLKYYSDALFDFPHWFGFSKRQFMLRLTLASRE
ncbi:hypothetical protein Q5P01_019338 [Channa striata]|uniref:Mesenteric estrogen-dependent adipogenesis protein n=1 Tax=Channa striata TaxID=64152 RepID=A0AA88M174_CHASR|nr:hypothetical protein Q5P01_019338 [Channa striata]